MFRNIIKDNKIYSLLLIFFYIILISFIAILCLNFTNEKEIYNNNNKKDIRRLSSIQITKFLNKIKYKDDEILDKSGMIDKAIDHDNIKIKINDYNVSKENEKIKNTIDEKPSNDFHTLLQYRYIIDENPENIFNYAQGDKNISKPKGNVLDFSDSINISSSSYIIQISSSINFDSPDTKIIKNLNKKEYILKNLQLGQIIYYRGAKDEEDLLSSKIYKLTTNNLPPRNLDIPGVANSRDIGGYKTNLTQNGIINQGLYYRTAAINDITDKGKEILTNDLGVKIEIDLREGDKNTGPYVDEVEYHPIPLPPWTFLYFEGYDEEYRKVFSLIAEADKNPIVLHCSAGADRTGIMTFALLTLLGCEYKDIARDYLFTNFDEQGQRKIDSEFNNWWNKLDNFEGENKAEKCKNWLMSKGIEELKLEHIRAIFINGYKENISLN